MIDMEKIRAELENHKVADIQRATGLHRNTISKIRMGKRPPKLETLNIILKFIDDQASAAK